MALLCMLDLVLYHLFDPNSDLSGQAPLHHHRAKLVVQMVNPLEQLQ